MCNSHPPAGSRDLCPRAREWPVRGSERGLGTHRPSKGARGRTWQRGLLAWLWRNIALPAWRTDLAKALLGLCHGTPGVAAPPGAHVFCNSGQRLLLASLPTSELGKDGASSNYPNLGRTNSDADPAARTSGQPQITPVNEQPTERERERAAPPPPDTAKTEDPPRSVRTGVSLHGVTRNVALSPHPWHLLVRLGNPSRVLAALGSPGNPWKPCQLVATLATLGIPRWLASLGKPWKPRKLGMPRASKELPMGLPRTAKNAQGLRMPCKG